MSASTSHHENWNEHQTTMFSSLHEKQKLGKFCDVTLKCCDSELTFNAHSCVLSAASEVLDKLLQNVMDSNSLDPGMKLVVVLPSDIGTSCMESLLNFIYSGNIDLSLNKPGKEKPTPVIRKSKRKSAMLVKNKSVENVSTSEESSDISSLYTFLRASKCLKIRTLTEYLESAITLSEMKIRNQAVIEKEAVKMAKLCLEKDAVKTEVANRQPDSTAQDDSQVYAEPSHNQQVDEDVAKSGVSSALAKADKLTCQKCHRKFKSRATLKRHACSDQHGSVARLDFNSQLSTRGKSHQANPKDFRSSELLMDPADEKKGPSQRLVVQDASVPEEIVSDATPPTHCATVELQGTPNKSVSDSIVVKKRPQRASALKFQTMMMATFGTENGDTQKNEEPSKTPKRKKRRQLVAVKNSADGTLTPAELHKTSGTQSSGACDPRESVVVSWNSVCKELESEIDDKLKEIEQDTVESSHPMESEIDSFQDMEFSQHSVASPDIVNVTEIKDMENLQTSDSDTESHMKKHDKQLRCEICVKDFRYKAALSRHMLFHSTEGMPCPVCAEGLHSQKDLRLHMAKHNRKKMRTECPVCGKSYTSHYVMELHRKTHSGDEKYSCHVCKKKFPYHSSLKMHMLLHTGERPYICSVCGKGFVQKVNAREHELQHDGIRRQYQCDLCDRYFSHKCGLTRHISDIHHKSRPYVCESCGKSFPRKTKLIEHCRMHTGEKPYICDICGVRYKANRSLKCHKKHRHNVLVPNYAVGIWKGPLPAERPVNDPLPPRKKLKITPTTFAFPISSEGEESIVDNIATEVDVVATEVPSAPSSKESLVASTLKEDHQQQYAYHVLADAYAAATGTSAYRETTVLPPASTLTRADPATLAYPMQGQKTFVVPLTSTGNAVVPVVAEQSHQFADHEHLPEMMLAYMSPQPTLTITERVDLGTVNASGVRMARSSSVPPMSTFSRHSGATAPEIPNTLPGTTTLPGMHTFQPVKLHPANSTILTGLTTVTPGVPVIVSMPPAMDVSQTVEVCTEGTIGSLHQISE